MEKTRYSGILFDKDGTLFDFQSTWGPWAAGLMYELANDNTQVAQRLAKALGLDLETELFLAHSPVIAGTNDEVVGVLSRELPDIPSSVLRNRLSLAGAQATPHPAPRLSETLATLSGLGLKLGVATNDSEVSARAQLDLAQVSQSFDFIAGFDSGYGGKPAPGMCLGFCSALGLKAQDVIMVGDSTHDLEAGRAAGMTCIAVLTGVATQTELAPHADAVLPDISYLPDWLVGEANP